MVKKFKRRKRIHISRLLVYIIIIIILYFFYKWVSNLSINKVNSEFLKYITSYYDSNSSNKYDDSPLFILNKYIYKLNNPQKLLINNIVYNENNNDEIKTVVNSNKQDDPLIYIYNTHQKETYNMTYVEDYNVIPDVLLMSHIIQEKFNNDGIKTIVEENNITEYLKTHDMNYGQSYEASRVFLKNILSSYNTLKLIIDLHRDAASHDATTQDINGLKCARIMFVIGKEYKTYNQNLEFTNALNDKINNKYPSLSRGVLVKSGFGVNGVYNQDLNNNIMLLELGGDKNNIDELINTINLIVPIIEEFIHEKK